MSLRTAVVVLVLLFAIAGLARAESFSGNVFVNDDGTLQVAGRTVTLYGIELLPGDATCYSFVRPPLCGPRVTVALRFHLGADFVRCQPIGNFPARGEATAARCWRSGIDGEEDIAAWLLGQGFAMTAPGAPASYRALEAVARAQHRGLWGVPVELAPRRRPFRR